MYKYRMLDYNLLRHWMPSIFVDIVYNHISYLQQFGSMMVNLDDNITNKIYFGYTSIKDH